MLLALGVIAAYFVGTFPTAQLVARLVGAGDPTTQGSGNPGASNVYRTAGKRAGVLVGVIDALKFNYVDDTTVFIDTDLGSPAISTSAWLYFWDEDEGEGEEDE